jgi:ribosomal protein S18 acetylase RimI-like enzyme
MEFRRYKPEDKQSCLDLFRSNQPKFFTEPELADFERFLDTQSDDYFVVTDNGHVVACGGFWVDRESGIARLCWGMVENARHHEGIGKLLLDARLDLLRRTPEVRAVALETSQHTFGFFEREGFVTEQITRDWYAPGLDRYEMIMTLDD